MNFRSMHYSDPITFYSTLSSYRTMEYAQTATWVWSEPAEMLFSQASTLIFTGDKGITCSSKASPESAIPELNPEFCPKWKTLLDILKVEIPHEIEKSNNHENKIVILCSDHKTCHQLKEVHIGKRVERSAT